METDSGSKCECSLCLAYEELVETLIYYRVQFFLLTSWSKMQILISIRGLVAYCFKQYDRLPTRRSKNGTSLELFSNLNVINPDHLESYLKWVNQSLFSFLWWNNRWIDDLKDNSITASCCLPDKCYLSQINLNELDL